MMSDQGPGEKQDPEQHNTSSPSEKGSPSNPQRRTLTDKVQDQFRHLAPPALFTIIALGLAWKNVENPSFTADDPKCGRTDDSHGLFSDAFFQFASALPHGQQRMRVHLFTIDPKEIPPLQPAEGESSEVMQDLDSRCVSRYFLAQLIRAIALLRPSVIAIDQTYSRVQCNKISNHFASEIESAVDAQPNSPRIVIGMPTRPLPDSEVRPGGPCMEELEGLDFRHDITAPPELPVDTESRWRIFPSSTTLDSDTLQIPLSWPVRLKRNEVAGPRDKDVDTFALRAAELADFAEPEQPAESVMQRVKDLHGEDNPFGRFIPADQLHSSTTNALQFLCASLSGKSVPGWSKETCTNVAQSEAVTRLISTGMPGYVAVVGFSDDNDSHAFLDGRLFGVQLQAEYIQALITGNYFTPWNWVLEVAMSLTIVWAFSIRIRQKQDNPLTVTGLIGLEFLVLAVVYFVSIEFNFFPAHVWALLSSIVIIAVLQIAEVIAGAIYDRHLERVKEAPEGPYKEQKAANRSNL